MLFSLVVKLAVAKVFPSGIVMDWVTFPTLRVSEHESDIGTPPLGAFAGEPLESWSWTMMAL